MLKIKFLFFVALYESVHELLLYENLTYRFLLKTINLWYMCVIVKNATPLQNFEVLHHYYIYLTILLSFICTPYVMRFTCVRVWPTRETEKQRRVIAPSRSIGLPAVLRLRQRFFVKKEPRARYYPIVSRVTRTHAWPSKHAEQRQPRVKNCAFGEPARDAARRDSKRSAFRVESRENRPRKINDARASVSAARDSLPLPLANDSRVINRSGGESFSVEKYRISRVCDARYPVITKFPTGFPAMICA